LIKNTSKAIGKKVKQMSVALQDLKNLGLPENIIKKRVFIMRSNIKSIKKIGKDLAKYKK